MGRSHNLRVINIILLWILYGLPILKLIISFLSIAVKEKGDKHLLFFKGLEKDYIAETFHKWIGKVTVYPGLCMSVVSRILDVGYRENINGDMQHTSIPRQLDVAFYLDCSLHSSRWSSCSTHVRFDCS